MKRLDSWLRVIGYAILLLAFLALAIGVKAQYEVNREARMQKWALISMELSDANLATSEWNSAVKGYKSLDDINTYELLTAIRKSQVANAKIEQYLETLDEPVIWAQGKTMKEFRCACGVLVITNDVTRTKCLTCEAKSEADAPLDEYPPDRFGDF
jgi:predicted CoA-binding protein